MKEITVLSLFNGAGGAFMALDELNVPIKKMYVSEIDKFANKAADLLNPNHTQLGDVTTWRDWGIDWSINILAAGSPCQGFSAAGKQGGTKAVITGESGRAIEITISSLIEYEFTRKLKLSDVSVEYLSCSYLFWEFVAILAHVKKINPDVVFLLENVGMTKNNMEMINKAVGCEPVMINSSLVTAQNRKRNYWANWDITQPDDKGILLKDIIEGGKVDRDKSLCVTTRIAGATAKRYLEKSQHQMVIDDKTIMSDTFTKRQEGRKCLVDKPKDKAANLSAMEYLKNGRQGDYIQCDNDGNQTVFRPCELRDTKPSESALCHHVATATDIRGNQAIKRVYAETGKAPTVTTMGGGHREPKILVASAGRNSEGKRVLREPSEEKSPTVTARYYKGVQSDGAPFVYSGEKVKGDEFDYKVDAPKYRKLTPRECMRLQGWPEHVIEKLLNSGDIATRYQSCYNNLSNKKERLKCKNAKSNVVSNLSQAKKLDCAISTTLDTLKTDVLGRIGCLSIKASYAQKKGAIVTAKLQKDCASNTTSDGRNSSQLTELLNVGFALKMQHSEIKACALDITTHCEDSATKTKLISIKIEDFNLTGIKGFSITKTLTVDGLIELLLKRSQEDLLEKEKLCIILMVINLIIAKGIFSSASQAHITSLCIGSLSTSHCNSLEMGISSLKMENTEVLSNSALYKMAGNGWTHPVIVHILQCLLNTGWLQKCD